MRTSVIDGVTSATADVGRTEDGAARDVLATRASSRPVRVLIPFGTPFLYGMERGVIEVFDALRPDVQPLFVQSRAILARRPPVIDELERRGLVFSLLPDRKGWPRLAKPQSARHFGALLVAFVKGNIYHAWCVRKADALYITGVNAALLSLLAAVYCRLTGRRVIHHFHDSGGNARVLAMWTPLVTDFIFNAEIGRQTIGGAHPGVRGKRSTVLPYIIEEHRDDARESRRPLLGPGRHLVYLGQVSAHKGVDMLLDAFRVVARRHPDASLDIVGGYAPEFEGRFQSLCAHPDLAGRVKHWGYREDAAALLREAYVYVQPSPPSRCQESFGRSVVEAMAAQVPIVCFPSGALQEIVVNGETGIVCDEDVNALAAALDRMLSDTSFRDACGAAAVRRYQQCYSPAVVRSRWLSFFTNL